MPEAQSFPSPRLLPLGDTALTVEFGDDIDPALNERVIAFADHVRSQAWHGLLDVVATFRSVTIHVDPLRLRLGDLITLIRRDAPPPASSASAGRLHEVPVWYGGAAGPDLDDLAAFAGLTVDEVIRLHSSIEYRVYMLGFTPGFPYLGAVPDVLAMPRLPTPRDSVPAGSVGIAGRQSGIYPVSTPGGWRLIGRTPRRLYEPDKPAPFLFTAGDRVRFVPIDRQAFERLVRLPC